MKSHLIKYCIYNTGQKNIDQYLLKAIITY